MDNFQFKNEISDNVFLTSVTSRFKEHHDRFKKQKTKKSMSRPKMNTFRMYEDKSQKFPKVKNQESVDK